MNCDNDLEQELAAERAAHAETRADALAEGKAKLRERGERQMQERATRQLSKEVMRLSASQCTPAERKVLDAMAAARLVIDPHHGSAIFEYSVDELIVCNAELARRGEKP